MRAPRDAPLRQLLLAQVVARIHGEGRRHPLRVGIDGICGAGKSTFARDLAGVLAARGAAVVCLDSDGFHHPRARRHRRPDDPARGYYEDAYDFDALADRVLRPLGPSGSRRYATRVHDLGSDEPVVDATTTAPSDAVVIFESTFLQDERLDGLWDLMIYLHADEDVALERGISRDAEALGGRSAAREAYERRYLAACRLYLVERDPRSRADLVVEHTDPAAPRIVVDRTGR